MTAIRITVCESNTADGETSLVTATLDAAFEQVRPEVVERLTDALLRGIHAADADDLHF